MLMKQQMDEIIYRALAEDIHYGDITTDSLIKEACPVSGQLIAKEEGVLAGVQFFIRVFEILDEQITITLTKGDGDAVHKGEVICQLGGDARSILKGERTALNILQRMSGIATMTHQLVQTVKGTKARIVDTRKTTPGLRALEKYAVTLGGGFNHRFNLSDAVLIKDNHIRSVGSIEEAIKRARAVIPHTMKIEVETETLSEVEEALRAKADIIMLDNMSCEQMREAILLINGRALTEASGNITIETIRQVAETGIDIISSGALTHSVKALDLSLKL